MAFASIELIHALRATAARLRDTFDYQWGHMGACNCGYLAQTVTSLGKAEIHAAALERRGDWEEQANAFCPESGYLIDEIIGALVRLGLGTDEIGQLEKLSGKEVLDRLPESRRHLVRNRRDDVVLYLETWADLLGEKLVARDRRAA
jgi:hypothetical protein